MGKYFSASRLGMSVALFAPLVAFAAEPADMARVTVFPDHYAVGENRFADLAALETWIKGTGARTLRLENCSDSSPGRVMAAVERFHEAYGDGVEIRSLGAGCAARFASTGASAQAVERSPYLAVDAQGRSLLP
jgi:hypothetical protein